ncbi:MAG: hypothetical protein IIZ67_03195 [Bacilli bacterium]|nr:hypothetical protein [Bacilli bacterium]
MYISKWVKISYDEYKHLCESDNDVMQVLVFNHVTDRWFIKTIKELKIFEKEVMSGMWELYLVSFVGKEICTDEVDFQEELDMIDDGIMDYGDE